MKSAGFRRGAFFAALLVTIVAGLVTPGLAQARITRIEITRVESPTFDGASFGTVGQYEKLVGRAYGEVDPADPKNAVIADIALAPHERRRHGRVLDGHLHPEAGRLDRRATTGCSTTSTTAAASSRCSTSTTPRQSAATIRRRLPTPATASSCARDTRSSWSGWDATVLAGQQPPHDHGSGRDESGRLLDRRPRARGVRDRQQHDDDGSPHLCRRRPRQVAGEPHRARALRRSAGVRSRRPAGTTSTRAATRSGCCPSGRRSSRAGSTSSPIRRRIRSSSVSGSRPPAMSPHFLRNAATDDHGNPNPLAGDAAVRSTRSASRSPVASCTTSCSWASTRTNRAAGDRRHAQLGRRRVAEASSTIASLSPHARTASTSAAGIRSASSRSPTR